MRVHSPAAPARAAGQLARHPSQETPLPSHAGGSGDLRPLHWSGAPDGRPWPPSPVRVARRAGVSAWAEARGSPRAGAAALERAHLHVALLPRVLAAADNHRGLVAPEKERVTCRPTARQSRPPPRAERTRRAAARHGARHARPVMSPLRNSHSSVARLKKGFVVVETSTLSSCGRGTAHVRHQRAPAARPRLGSPTGAAPDARWRRTRGAQAPARCPAARCRRLGFCILNTAIFAPGTNRS